MMKFRPHRLILLPSGFTLRPDQVITELSRAFALCASSDEATEIRDDAALFQGIQAALNKQSSGNRKTPEQIDAAVCQLVSKAITTDGQVIDVFNAAGQLSANGAEHISPGQRPGIA